MAWYSEEEYEFRKDSCEKKNIAASARKMKTHAGKGGAVKFPSDYLSRKELNAMNGEVMEYKLGAPMSWDNFKKLPDDKKVYYITRIRERFEATDSAIAEMFGVAQNTLSCYLLDLKIGRGKNNGGGRRKWDKDAFYRWAFPTRYLNESENIAEQGVNEPEDIAEQGVNEAVCEAMEADAEIKQVAEALASGEKKIDILHNLVEVGPDVDETKKVDEMLGHLVNPRIAIPKSGSMTFESPACMAVATLQALLGNANVRLKVEWEVVG